MVFTPEIQRAKDTNCRVDWSHRTPGPILVATDASLSADAAIRAAKALSAARGVPVVAVSVVPTLPYIVGGSALGAPEVVLPMDPSISFALRSERRTQVRDQLARTGVTEPWRVMVRHGITALEIAAAARELSASLIVVGLTRHSLWDRVLGRENALAIVRSAPVPVLATMMDIELDGARILAAVDFTPASESAAQAAFGFAPSHAKVQVVHVRDGSTRRGFDEWIGLDRAAPDGDFGLLRTLIPAPPEVDVAYGTIDGHVTTAVLERAESWDASLIVVATHGGGLLRRLVVGSVTTDLLRRATRPLLIVPAPATTSRSMSERTPRVAYA